MSSRAPAAATREIQQLVRALETATEQQRAICNRVGALGERDDLPAPAYAALEALAADLGAQVLALVAVCERVDALVALLMGNGEARG